MAPEPVAFAVSRWFDDPWTRGGWSLLRAGASPETRRLLGKPIGGRLLLAGEATHPHQAGMVHGAYEEGMRAGQWAIDAGCWRVVVVGAGAAGLGAARMLADGGCDVTVLEARDRIGGRVHTLPLGHDGVVVELGANWLQQGDRNSFAPRAEELGLELIPTDFHQPLDLGLAVSLEDSLLLAELRGRLAMAPVEVSLGEVVDGWLADVDGEQRELIDSVVDAEVYLDGGASLHDLSGRFGAEPGVGRGDRWVRAGYVRLLESLAAGIDVRLGWPVASVQVRDDGVGLVGADGELLGADAVIVTVPAAVLAAGGITFDPPLPSSHLDALSLLMTGRVEKVALRFAERFWPVSGSGYLRIFGERRHCVAEFLDLTDATGAAVITGLFVGPWLVDMWDGHSDAEVASAVAELLGSISAT